MYVEVWHYRNNRFFGIHTYLPTHIHTKRRSNTSEWCFLQPTSYRHAWAKRWSHKYFHYNHNNQNVHNIGNALINSWAFTTFAAVTTFTIKTVATTTTRTLFVSSFIRYLEHRSPHSNSSTFYDTPVAPRTRQKNEAILRISRTGCPERIFGGTGASMPRPLSVVWKISCPIIHALTSARLAPLLLSSYFARPLTACLQLYVSYVWYGSEQAVNLAGAPHFSHRTTRFNLVKNFQHSSISSVLRGHPKMRRSYAYNMLKKNFSISAHLFV